MPILPESSATTPLEVQVHPNSQESKIFETVLALKAIFRERNNQLLAELWEQLNTLYKELQKISPAAVAEKFPPLPQPKEEVLKEPYLGERSHELLTLFEIFLQKLALLTYPTETGYEDTQYMNLLNNFLSLYKVVASVSGVTAGEDSAAPTE